jgi:hypothetical protein
MKEECCGLRLTLHCGLYEEINFVLNDFIRLLSIIMSAKSDKRSRKGSFLKEA